MGQAASCGNSEGQLMSDAIRTGDVDLVKKMLERDPKLLKKPASYRRLTPLHLAALYGRPQVLNLLLEQGAEPDVCCNRSKTPLMVACKRGKVACVERLLQCGANALVFEACNGRTCLHYAAREGHYDCVEKVIRAARAGPVAESWGFARFVNVRDATGATPLHMAARAGEAAICRLLLDSGALVSATTSTFGYGPRHGSTPLHCAARGGSVEVVLELLAWGADRTQRDLMGYTPYGIALKHNNVGCASILNPNVAEPMVWPSPWKFISNLEPQAKMVLEAALAAANKERDKNLSTIVTQNEAAGLDCESVQGKLEDELHEEPIEMGGLGIMEICCICFEKFCTIEVKDCGHQMCASCTLALCCHNKPNPAIPYSPPPACPFCRGSIGQLVLAQPKYTELKHIDMKELAKSRSKRSKKRSWGSRGSKSSGGGSRGSRGSKSSGGGSRGSFSRISGKGSGRIIDTEWINCL